MKPCPFCGSTKLKVSKRNSTTKFSLETQRVETKITLSVNCNKCFARGSIVTAVMPMNNDSLEQLKQQAIDEWNKRFDENKELQKIIELQEIIDKVNNIPCVSFVLNENGISMIGGGGVSN